MPLSEQGRTALDNFIQQFHQAAGVPAGTQFAVEPRVMQTLHDRIIEDGSPFLGRINIPLVSEIKGQKIHMGVTKLVTRRTDTTGDDERVATNPSALDDTTYECHKQDTDVGLRYDLIDSWAHFPDFANRYQRHIRKAIANDLVRVGWHGESVATTTNPTANPLGQDVNIGWLKQIKDWTGNDGNQHLDTLTIGSSGDFKNLDALVTGMKYDGIDVAFHDYPGMTVITSSDLIGNVEGQFHADNASTPSEKIHVYEGLVMQAFGGLPVITAPFLPAGTVLVTPLENLSIYTQRTSRRRAQIDNPKKDQYEDFNSANIGYVVEQLGAAALATTVTFV